jgi:uncharacterized protein YjiS (DUF1127 family)
MTVGTRKFASVTAIRTPASSSTSFAAGLAIGLKGLNDALVTVFDTVLDWQDRARQRNRLGEMDDHLLRDVGLSRADLEHEAAKPFWRA